MIGREHEKKMGNEVGVRLQGQTDVVCPKDPAGSTLTDSMVTASLQSYQTKRLRGVDTEYL